MDNEQAFALLKKYNSGECTEIERVLVEESFFAFNEQSVEISFEKLKTLKKEIAGNLPVKNTRAKYKKLAIAVTSAAAAVIALGIYLIIQKNETHTTGNLVLAENIFPKGNAALITFSNGRTINLDKNQKEVKISGLDLTYNDGSKVNINETGAFQTISTPNGGEYKIVLSDGTKVWLNAATVLQYPSTFRERVERRVKLVSGQAYFEVAKDTKHPFVVTTQNQDVMVLGTRFDINANSENIKTTLLEGSISLKLATNNKTRHLPLILVPGNQSINHSDYLTKTSVDTSLVVAWKNGKLKFQNANLETILSEAERWYDIQVKYESSVPDIQLTGGISRKSNLATLLRLLKLSGIKFKVDNVSGKNILSIAPL
ncbi:FecR family protein [Pedobacter jeongneungensis]|uniref:FecR family protein n=1 Tax=Pedobacter jeongneungensis TaxID=947309 RepID=UPI000468DBBD|nr:FecR family protein [Pedobacter jeongneungensis]